MPSQLHELLLMLLRTPSALLVQSLRVSQRVRVPLYREARPDSADFTDIQPAEYRADLVTTLVAEDGSDVLSIIVEVQLARDERKRYVWPVYAASLRARLECPVCLMVLTLDESVARWAAQPIEFGGGSTFIPVVVGPAQIAQVTEVEEARKLPELAVLSALAHGQSADTQKAVKIAIAAMRACEGLESYRARFYRDAVYASISEAARQEVKKVDMKKWEPPSDWARVFVAEGSAEIIRRQLTARFGPIAPEIESRIGAASADELGDIGLRILTATTLEQVFGGG